MIYGNKARSREGLVNHLDLLEGQESLFSESFVKNWLFTCILMIFPNSKWDVLAGAGKCYDIRISKYCQMFTFITITHKAICEKRQALFDLTLPNLSISLKIYFPHNEAIFPNQAFQITNKPSKFKRKYVFTCFT